MSETLETLVPSQATPNPLLMAWQTPFETPPFAEIAPEHFLPAFEQAFADHTAEITAITYDPTTPDFANTITALERRIPTRRCSRSTRKCRCGWRGTGTRS